MFAIFAHNEDFEYDQENLINKLDDCVTIEQLQKNDLPKILCQQDFTVIFD